jgi:hypothetical protein
MAPTPDWDAPFIKGIQRNWHDHIKPAHDTYHHFLSSLLSIFGFASAISLLCLHKFQLPKWPFTEEHWNPKPTVEKTKEEKEKEVTEEELEEDEMALAAGGIVKRSFGMEETKRHRRAVQFIG